MTLTNTQAAYRYLCGEAVIVERHLGLHDINEAAALRRMHEATQEARRMFLQEQPGAEIKVAVSRRGKVMVNVHPLT